jgi:hypothetical protein
MVAPLATPEMEFQALTSKTGVPVHPHHLSVRNQTSRLLNLPGSTSCAIEWVNNRRCFVLLDLLSRPILGAI